MCNKSAVKLPYSPNRSWKIVRSRYNGLFIYIKLERLIQFFFRSCSFQQTTISPMYKIICNNETYLPERLIFGESPSYFAWSIFNRCDTMRMWICDAIHHTSSWGKEKKGKERNMHLCTERNCRKNGTKTFPRLRIKKDHLVHFFFFLFKSN